MLEILSLPEKLPLPVGCGFHLNPTHRRGI